MSKRKGQLEMPPVDLLEKEIKRVYGIVAGQALKGDIVRREYELEA